MAARGEFNDLISRLELAIDRANEPQGAPVKVTIKDAILLCKTLEFQTPAERFNACVASTG